MKKIVMMMAVVGASASAFAGCGSGCFNNCNYPPCNPGGPGTCGVQGVTPDVREYRANPNQGVYSTGDGLPANAPAQNGMKQGPWQNNNPQARNQEADRRLYADLQNMLRGNNLSITVNGGVVTLQGRVSSEEEKKAIGDRVNSLPAVKRLNNKIEVWNQDTNPWKQAQDQRNH